MARVGLAMLFHDKVKLAGTLFGVIFAVVLSDEQAGTFLGLLYKNVMFIERSTADLWIVPQGVEVFGPGQDMGTSNATMTKGVANVAWAEPLLVGTGNVQLPEGGSQQVTLIGSKFPYEAGGPWAVVRGDASALREPGTVLFEDGDRDNLGRLDLGSVRELNGRRVTVGGFTWGLIPFGPSYAFADYDLARELTGVEADRANYVMVKVTPGADVAAVAASLKAHVEDAQVLTKRDFIRVCVRHVLLKTAVGVTLGTSTLFGLVVGFVIVALSMFSAVVDNIREFGTLKAVGSTNLDLMILLFTQAVAVALLGSVLGLAIVSEIAVLMRSPRLAVLLPPWLMFGSAAVMVILCVVASCLALQRIRKVEPAMVFR
jgi:putative ABC transport system permease protein